MNAASLRKYVRIQLVSGSAALSEGGQRLSAGGQLLRACAERDGADVGGAASAPCFRAVMDVKSAVLNLLGCPILHYTAALSGVNETIMRKKVADSPLGSNFRLDHGLVAPD